MAQLLVRNLDDDVKARLRALATQHGRSIEEEVRAILRAAVAPPSQLHSGSALAEPDTRQPRLGLGTEIAALFKQHGLRDGDEIPEMRGQMVPPWKFEDC